MKDLAEISEHIVGNILGRNRQAAQAPAAAPVPPPAPAYSAAPQPELVKVAPPPAPPPAPAPAVRGPVKAAVYITGSPLGKALNTPISNALKNSGAYAGIESIDAFVSGAADDRQISSAGARAGVQYVFVINVATPISVAIVDVEAAATTAKVSIDGQITALNAGAIAKKIIDFILKSGPQPVPAAAAHVATAERGTVHAVETYDYADGRKSEEPRTIIYSRAGYRQFVLNDDDYNNDYYDSYSETASGLDFSAGVRGFSRGSGRFGLGIEFGYTSHNYKGKRTRHELDYDYYYYYGIERYHTINQTYEQKMSRTLLSVESIYRMGTHETHLSASLRMLLVASTSTTFSYKEESGGYSNNDNDKTTADFEKPDYALRITGRYKHLGLWLEKQLSTNADLYDTWYPMAVKFNISGFLPAGSHIEIVPSVTFWTISPSRYGEELIWSVGVNRLF